MEELSARRQSRDSRAAASGAAGKIRMRRNIVKIECISKQFFSQKKCLFVRFGGANVLFAKKMFVSKRTLLINLFQNKLFKKMFVCFLAEAQSRGVLPQGGEELGKCYCRSLRIGRGACADLQSS